MAGSKLKEFLVSIAYQVDRSSEQRFAASVTSATKAAEALGVAVAAASAAVVTGVAVMTSHFERLYYASQRTGASVTNIKAFGFAVGQMGSSVEAGQSSLENFTRSLREAPARFQQLRDLGVRVTGANGKLRDTVDILKDFGRVLSHKDYFVALQYGQQFGIDEQTLRAIMQNVDAFAEQYKAKLREVGLDPEEAARRAAKFQNTWRSVEAMFDAVGVKIGDVFAQRLQGPLERFDKFLDRNAGKITAVIEQIAAALGRLADAIFTDENMQKFQEWVNWLCKPETWKGLVQALQDVGRGFADAWAKAKAFFDGVMWFYNSPGGQFFFDPRGLGERMHRDLFGDGGSGGTLGDDSTAGGGGGSGWAGKAWGKVKSALGFGGGGGGGAPIGKLAQNENARAVIDELRKAGYNDNAIAAVVGSMQTESSFNPKVRNASGHTGLWQWDGARRWPKIEAWIKSQGGDPGDARWQARAWVAEHNARPGDAIYDNGGTAAGGRLLRDNPSLEAAIHGVQMSERFGVGEEGNRAANARNWLPHVASRPASPTPAPPVVVKPGTELPQFHLHQGPMVGSNGGRDNVFTTPYFNRPEFNHLLPPATSNDNSRGDTTVQQHNTTHITVNGAGGDAAGVGRVVGEHVSHAQGTAVRNITGAVQ